MYSDLEQARAIGPSRSRLLLEGNFTVKYTLHSLAALAVLRTLRPIGQGFLPQPKLIFQHGERVGHLSFEAMLVGFCDAAGAVLRDGLGLSMIRLFGSSAVSILLAKAVKQCDAGVH